MYFTAGNGSTFSHYSARSEINKRKENEMGAETGREDEGGSPR